jgi:antitoxin (DNA-binding transcriptional repressor) of toxin-antitoxin stability system
VIRTVNIRELKNRLSAYLRDVKGGDVVLVSDRGRVVAEIRQPTVGAHAIDAAAGKRQRLVEAGVLQPGLPHDPALYREPPRVKLSAAAVDAALAFTRGER